MPHKSDMVRLPHMRDAAQQALGYMRGRTRADLNTDTQLAQAVVYCLPVVGEAANQISVEGRTLRPSIPWGAIVGMRNRLVHAYFDIDLDRVWDTVTSDLPALLAELRRALAQET